MAIRGRRPAGQGVSNNRHAPVHRWTDVVDERFAGGPKLPPRRANGKPWPSATKRRWATWATMPHCVLWQPSDWQFAMTALEIAARFDDTSSVSWATELRAWERVMGTTRDARAGQRIRYVEPASAAPASVPRLDDFRDL